MLFGSAPQCLVLTTDRLSIYIHTYISGYEYPQMCIYIYICMYVHIKQASPYTYIDFNKAQCFLLNWSTYLCVAIFICMCLCLSVYIYISIYVSHMITPPTHIHYIQTYYVYSSCCS